MAAVIQAMMEAAPRSFEEGAPGDPDKRDFHLVYMSSVIWPMTLGMPTTFNFALKKAGTDGPEAYVIPDAATVHLRGEAIRQIGETKATFDIQMTIADRDAGTAGVEIGGDVDTACLYLAQVVVKVGATETAAPKKLRIEVREPIGA